VLSCEENFQGGAGTFFGLVGEKYGWVVEVDPADPSWRACKHTAMGRVRHENVAMRAVAGRKITAYMGDDRRGGHIWKYVSDGRVHDLKSRSSSRLLEQGTLFVARLNPDGTGKWIPLVPDTAVDPGSKLHLVCDGGRLPLTATITAANVGDTTMLEAILDDVPPIRMPSGAARTRPGTVHADKGDDSRANRSYLRRRGIRQRIARRGVEPSTRLGRHRWRVERSLSWLSCWRRLQVRWDRDSGRWFAFVLLACAVSVSTGSNQPRE
jgi:hypothetical protein